MSKVLQSTKSLDSTESDRLSWQEQQLREQGEYDLDLQNARVREAHSRADELEDRVAQRIRYARIFVSWGWSWVIIVLIISVFSGIAAIPFRLSDPVLMFLLGSGTVNVLTPAFLVAKYLFGESNRNGRN